MCALLRMPKFLLAFYEKEWGVLVWSVASTWYAPVPLVLYGLFRVRVPKEQRVVMYATRPIRVIFLVSMIQHLYLPALRSLLRGGYVYDTRCCRTCAKSGANCLSRNSVAFSPANIFSFFGSLVLHVRMLVMFSCAFCRCLKNTLGRS